MPKVSFFLIVILLAFGCLAWAAEEPDLLLADFEGKDYGKWTITGDAFGTGPAQGTLPGQQPVTGFLGKGLANSFHKGDKSTGTLTSPEFVLERRYLNFLIGGGHHPGETGMELLLDDKVVRTATGMATTGADDEHLSWNTWDVDDLKGKRVRVRIFDRHTGDWGHINVDHIVQSNQRKRAEYANESLTDAMASVQGAIGRVAADRTRPIYHVLPPALWCNDPNGPLYYKGEYHLFYQHNPFGDRWEHMHWGHVRSKDLVHWEHQPIALWPSKEKGEDHCFSGCAVVNDQGQPMMIYTSIGKRAPEQWGAISEGDLSVWKKHPANPLLTEKLHGDVKIDDWRDPFVFKAEGKWFLVAGGHRPGGKGCIELYASEDLVKWRFLGIPFEGQEANWECPNFFPLGDKWVLIYSPHGIVKYYTGKFDLKTYNFTPEYHGTLDHGSAFYAPNGLEDGQKRRILWGWVRDFPGGRGWNGCLTIPRVLTLASDGQLIQQPAPELQQLRSKPAGRLDLSLKNEGKVLEGITGDTLEIRAEFEPGDAKSLGIRLRRSAEGKRAVTVSYDGSHLDVAGTRVPLKLSADKPNLRLHLFLDRSVLEVYANGTICVTRVLAAPPEDQAVEVFAKEGNASLKSLHAWQMGSIWSK